MQSIPALVITVLLFSCSNTWIFSLILYGCFPGRTSIWQIKLLTWLHVMKKLWNLSHIRPRNLLIGPPHQSICRWKFAYRLIQKLQWKGVVTNSMKSLPKEVFVAWRPTCDPASQLSVWEIKMEKTCWRNVEQCFSFREEALKGLKDRVLARSLQNRLHTPGQSTPVYDQDMGQAIHWSFPAQGTWHRTGFADQAPGQGMYHTHTLIRVPWAGYEQCTLARVYKKWYIPWAGYEQPCTLARV